ncbi:hypothetical protein MKW98_008498 [Papaver atlanticum]|uniref:Factor of DNA methylation 1-5/IDN2 domain-containing protein n=1 Tax=Papaver atlanticum TaxID=357466 RepID=A0AAD4XVF9_9MAGN|nr:hypothetical protein MKW98_008498 [Papaver atlanticum]
MDSKKRIRAEDYEKMMIHELESEVIQRQSMLHDMRIPKTSLEIALIKLSLFQKVLVDIQKLQTRIGELERQLDYKTELQNEVEIIIEAEVEKLQSKVASLEKQADDKTDEAKRLKGTIDELTKSMNEKTECIESLEDLNKILTVNEHRHNDELQKARKTLIQGIGESANSRSSIRVKRMGELDSKPFGDALKRKRSSSSADLVANQSVLLCNFWELMLTDQAWHPFKITLVDGKHQVIYHSISLATYTSS